MKKLAQMIIIMILCALVGWGLLLAVYSIPTEKMACNMIPSSQVIAEEGYTPTSVTPYLSSRDDNGKRSIRRMLFNSWITLRDNFTDALMLETAACVGKGSVAEQSLSAYSYNSSPIEALESLYVNQSDNNELEIGDYARYWHGYLVILKPLLLILNYSEIRLLNYAIGFILLVLLLFEMRKEFSWKYICLFFYSMLFVAPYIIPLCMQFTTVFFPLLIGLIVLVKWRDSLFRNNRLMLYFLFMGIAVNYFDLLTYPLVSWGIPLLVVLALDSEKKEFGLRQLCAFSFSWLFGYAGMWIAKWTIGSIVLKKNLFSDAMEQLVFRTSHVSPDKVTPINIIYILGEHLYKYANIVYILLILLALITLCLAIARNKNKINTRLFFKEHYIYLLICVAPVVWYQLTLNHSVHPYTYRILWIAVLAGLTFLYRLAGFSFLQKRNLSKIE